MAAKPHNSFDRLAQNKPQTKETPSEMARFPFCKAAWRTGDVQEKQSATGVRVHNPLMASHFTWPAGMPSDTLGPEEVPKRQFHAPNDTHCPPPNPL